MLVVTKIETFETPMDTAQLERFIYANPQKPEYLPIDGEPVNVQVLKEVIRGRRFVHPKKGIDVTIGMSSQVAEVLGLQYEAFEELQRQRNFWYEQHGEEFQRAEKMKWRLDRIKSYGLWKRIKCVFTGMKI